MVRCLFALTHANYYLFYVIIGIELGKKKGYKIKLSPSTVRTSSRPKKYTFLN